MEGHRTVWGEHSSVWYIALTRRRRRRRVWSKADSRAFGCKRRNLHGDTHVTAENKRPRSWKQMHITAVLSYRTCIYFYVYEAAMQTNDLHIVAVFNLRKGKGGIWSVLFLAVYQNGDQYYDAGPLFPIQENSLLTLLLGPRARVSLSFISWSSRTPLYSL